MNDPDLVLDKFNRNQQTWATVLKHKQEVADKRKYEQGKMLGHYFNQEKAQRKAQKLVKEAKEYNNNEKQEKVVAVHKRRVQHERDLASRKQRLYDSKHSPQKSMAKHIDHDATLQPEGYGHEPGLQQDKLSAHFASSLRAKSAAPKKLDSLKAEEDVNI